MYLKEPYRIKAGICRRVFGKTKFFLGERVDYAHDKDDFWDSALFQSKDRDVYFASYTRYKTIELLANELKEKKVPGEVAELGVYKGTTSMALNFLFAEKKIYMFDTYEGFDDAQVSMDVERGFSKEKHDLTDTSAEAVYSRMLYKEKCIIKKGFFPSTADGLVEQFCFVSLDTDLYQPILDGLRYFYPRVTKGGYIIVHDYNNGTFKGVKQAVKDFQSEIDEMLHVVPIVDLCGSLVISK
ncbi:MAG: methyltransferase [Lachnospiraceae bacterium]|nr:methyltransferase [Lachnospiraceae bacterium]